MTASASLMSQQPGCPTSGSERLSSAAFSPVPPQGDASAETSVPISWRTCGSASRQRRASIARTWLRKAITHVSAGSRGVFPLLVGEVRAVGSDRSIAMEAGTSFESQLRRLLYRAAGILHPPASLPDAVRTAVQTLVPKVAMELDANFVSGTTAAPGPVQVVDLFSGCGGMSAGFASINGLVPAYRLLAAADIDAVANRSYHGNLGIRPDELDIGQAARDPGSSPVLRRVQAERASNPLVLIGCAPCQGFSSHRNSAGRSDPRNGLFADFVTVALHLEPDVIVAENVPELLATRYWPHVESARQRLSAAGYKVHLSVHNMAEFGVPQDRFRALLLAARSPLPPPAGFLKRPEFRTVRQAIGHLASISPGVPDAGDPLHVTAGHRSSTVATISSVPRDGGSRPPWEGPASLKRVAARQGKPAYEDVYGRLWWDRPSITITAYARNPASGRFSHPEQNRGLSIREAALLQGFPNSYRLTGSLDPCFRQIGNAVPPQFSAVLALHVLGHLLGADYPETSGIQAPVGASFSRLIPSLKAESSERTVEALVRRRSLAGAC